MAKSNKNKQKNNNNKTNKQIKKRDKNKTVNSTKDDPNFSNCLNTSISIKGNAKNILTKNINIFKNSNNNKNLKTKTSPKVVEKIPEEVFSNDMKIMEIICKYLTLEEKKKLTLTCKRFNYIVSEKDIFSLTFNFESFIRFIPKLKRSYSTVYFKYYKCNVLKPDMSKLFDHLNESMINFTLDDCELNIKSLYRILLKLPRLKSLELNLKLNTKNIVEIPANAEPKLLNLKVLKIRVNDNMWKEIFTLLESAVNLESLSLFNANFKFDVFDCIKKYEKSLESLSLTKCLIENQDMSNGLLFGKQKKPSKSYEKFDCLQQLRALELKQVDTEILSILQSKCIEKIKDFTIIYNYKQGTKVKIFLHLHLLKIEDGASFNETMIPISQLKVKCYPKLYYNGNKIDTDGAHDIINNDPNKIEIDHINSDDENTITLSFTIKPVFSNTTEANFTESEFLEKLNDYHNEYLKNLNIHLDLAVKRVRKNKLLRKKFIQDCENSSPNDQVI